jgi:photosystem II stability/assembly factor-like uncharacterized protein
LVRRGIPREVKLVPTFLAIAAAGIVVAIAGAAPATWRETAAPEGGPVYALSISADGSTLHAGTDAGIFTRRGGGTRWDRGELRRVREAQISDIEAASATRAYAAGTGPHDTAFVLRTSDAGRTWQRIGNPLDDEAADLAVSPSSADVVYAAGIDGVARSTDGGTRWSEPRGPTVDDEIAVDPTDSETIYAQDVESGEMALSRDGGQSWTDASAGLPPEVFVTALAVTPASAVVYAGTEEHGVFRLVAGTGAWQAATTGLPTCERRYALVFDLQVDRVARNVVYAATANGMAISTDAGLTWQATGGGCARRVVGLAVGPAGALFGAARHEGVLESVNGGRHWEPLASSGLTAHVPNVLAVHPRAARTVYLGTDGSGLVTTTDGGASWSAAERRAGGTITAAVFDRRVPRIAYVASEAGVLKTSNGGASWTSASRGLPPGPVGDLAIDPRNRRTLYAARKGVFKSTDAGRSWRPTRAPRSAADFHALALDPARPGTVYAANAPRNEDRMGVYVSTDGGRTWKRRSAGLNNGRGDRSQVNALAVAPRSGDVYATSFDGVFRLRRGAGRWARVNAGLPALPGRGAPGVVAWVGPIAIHPRTGAVSVGTTRGLYDLRGTNGRLRWQLADRRFAERSVTALAYAANGSRLYAATRGRFFVRR